MNLNRQGFVKNVEVVACDKCGCTWLTQVSVNRYSTLPQSLAMEAVPVHFDADFHVLMCAGCGQIVFPPVESWQMGSAAHVLYEEMAEEIAGSAEKALERLAGAAIEKTAGNVKNNIPNKPVQVGFFRLKKQIQDIEKEQKG